MAGAALARPAMDRSSARYPIAPAMTPAGSCGAFRKRAIVEMGVDRRGLALALSKQPDGPCEPGVHEALRSPGVRHPWMRMTCATGTLGRGRCIGERIWPTTWVPDICGGVIEFVAAPDLRLPGSCARPDGRHALVSVVWRRSPRPAVRQ